VLRPLFRLLWDIDVAGLHHVPSSGPAVLCPNHLAAIDSFFLPVVLPREVIFVGKAEYLDDWRTRTLFPALGMIPIDRRGGIHAIAALDAARSVLRGGGLFAIYPEGTRSRSGKLHRGHTGAARLAVETGAPLIPVGLVGTPEIQPLDTTLPRPFRPVSVTFGQPIATGGDRSPPGDPAAFRQLTDEVMFEIQRMTGQDYDPSYATSATDPEPITGSLAPPRSSAEVLVSHPLKGVG
jgi:1-acyl-sn-glycerol-3-phosphate acyltransferase